MWRIGDWLPGRCAAECINFDSILVGRENAAVLCGISVGGFLLGESSMGTSISYRTFDTVPDDIRRRVITFLELESTHREWWAESIVLFDDPQAPGHICGATKLFCLLDDDIAADCYMAMKDADFIIELLEEVSKEHRIGWRLFVAGEPAGEIRSGRRNVVAQQLLDSFNLLAGVEDVEFGQFDRESLLRQYPDR